MRFISKIVHKIIKGLSIEPLFIRLSVYSRFFQKFIPLHYAYKEGSYKKVTRDKTLFTLDISDYMQWYVWAGLEDISWKLAKQYSKPNASIFDIGANVGAFAVKLANNTEDNTIYAFEPNPYVYKHFVKNLDNNKPASNSIIPNMLGVGHKKESLGFIWEKANSGGGKFTKEKKQDKLEIISLDHYVKEHKISNIDFVKIDVEGFEPFVVEGAVETIQNELPVVYIEVSPKWWNDKGYTTESVLEIFKKQNYSFLLETSDYQVLKIDWRTVVNLEKQHNLILLPPKEVNRNA